MPVKTFDRLESQFGDFDAPEVDIFINGRSVKLNDMAIGWAEVERSTESEADLATFAIANAFQWNPVEVAGFGDLIKIGQTLVIEMGYADRKQKVFDGLITGYTIDYPENGSPAFKVTGMDRSVLLMKTSHSHIFSDMKASDVVMQVAGQHGLVYEVDDTKFKKDIIEQLGISDYHLLRSLAEEYDYRFYVSGKKLYFKKPNVSGEPVLEYQFGYTLSSFTLRVDVTTQTGQVEVRGYNSDDKKGVEATVGSVRRIGNASRTGPSYASALSAKKKEILYAQTASSDEAKMLADAMLNRLSRDFVKARGSSIGVPSLEPGEIVQIVGTGLQQGPLKLLVTRVTHRIDANGYVTTFEAEGNAI